jgi:hypothetical protein
MNIDNIPFSDKRIKPTKHHVIRDFEAILNSVLHHGSMQQPAGIDYEAAVDRG